MSNDDEVLVRLPIASMLTHLSVAVSSLAAVTQALINNERNMAEEFQQRASTSMDEVIALLERAIDETDVKS